MSRGRKLRPFAAARGALLLAVMATAVSCGGGKETVRATGGAEAKKAAAEAVDTSTSADWQANCAQFRRYNGELIFTATETTAADGKRAVAWMANDRGAFLAVFRDLTLDGVPELKQRRDRIVAEAEKAPGDRTVAIFPDLSALIDSLWSDIAAAARKHGVDCK